MEFLTGCFVGVAFCGVIWFAWMVREDFSKKGWDNFWRSDDICLRPWARWVRNKLGGQRPPTKFHTLLCKCKICRENLLK